MARASSLYGMRSSRTAISDDEASDVSSEPNVNVKSDKKGKGNGKGKGKEPVVEASLMVESEDDDEEIAEDELVDLSCYRRRSLIDWLAGMWLRLSPIISSMRRFVFICPGDSYTGKAADEFGIDGKSAFRGEVGGLGQEV
jgi:hypothetical protein